MIPTVALNIFWNVIFIPSPPKGSQIQGLVPISQESLSLPFNLGVFTHTLLKCCRLFPGLSVKGCQKKNLGPLIRQSNPGIEHG